MENLMGSLRGDSIFSSRLSWILCLFVATVGGGQAMVADKDRFAGGET